jgi:hypothetical protein
MRRFTQPVTQPEMKFAFPVPERGASDQSFRMIVRPDVWGARTRIRLSNVFGTKPITFDGVFRTRRGGLPRGSQADGICNSVLG